LKPHVTLGDLVGAQFDVTERRSKGMAAMEEHQAAISEALLDEPGTCSDCGTTRYTRRELNLSNDQHWLCYRCLDKLRRCSVGSCKRNGKCMYLNHPRCPKEGTTP
jgi:hypothetical protein